MLNRSFGCAKKKNLGPIRTLTFQRERRQMQSTGPSSPGSCTPTNQRGFPGNTCGHISLSPSTARILTRSVNIKVRIKMLSIIDGTKTSATWVHTKQPKPFRGLILMSQWWASTLTISQRRKLSKTPRTSMLAGGKLKKAPTDSRNSFFRMLGTIFFYWSLITSPL